MPRSAAFDHVAGERKGCSAEADHRQAGAEVARDKPHRFRHVAQFRGAISLELSYRVRIPHRLVDLRPFIGAELEIEPHHLQRQQQVGKNDGCIDSQTFSRGDGHVSGNFRVFADLEKRMLLTYAAVLRHVTPGLTHEPNRRRVYRLTAAGANKP